MPKRSRGIGIYLAMLLILLLLATYAFSSMNTNTQTYNYTEIISYFQHNQVGEYSLDLGTGELVIDSMIERVELEKPRELTEEEQEWITKKELGGQFQALSEEAQAALTVAEAEKYKADLEEQKKFEELRAIKEIRQLEAEGRIFYKDGGRAVIFRKLAEPMIYKVPNVGLFVEDTRELVFAYNSALPAAEQIHGDYIPAQEMPWWISILPTMLLIGLMVVFYVVIMRQSRGGGNVAGFGKAKAKSANDGRKVTFEDVAGADEEKEELVEVVEFLKSPNKFNTLGARIPKGVLLVGPPGTGKTLLARAVAGEAGVQFFSISGSDFVEMFVGVGASRVRDLFDQAKKSSPSVIFIDEIDAVGRQRGAGLGGGHDEREQTLNQLLVEMDGFGANNGVIIIAATNRRDILDPALLRPGRFDRQIIVGYPDIKGREEILKVHSRNKPMGPDVSLRTIAQTTAGFTGADLENLVNEAALLAARKNLKAITMMEIEEATIKVVAGPEKRSHVVTEKDKRLTAYHEAGHALCTYYCPTQDPVHQISIIPRGMAGGYTMSLPSEDRNYVTKTHMYENIVVLMGGRVAEQLILDDISTGASNDLERATKTAREMVTRYGFSERIGPIVYGSNPNEVFLGRDYMHSRDFSEKIASEIDAEVRSLMDKAYKTSIDLISSHMDKLESIARYLIRNEKIDGPDFEKLMHGELEEAPEEDPFNLKADPFGLNRDQES